jgi:hypothetical protein
MALEEAEDGPDFSGGPRKIVIGNLRSQIAAASLLWGCKRS